MRSSGRGRGGPRRGRGAYKPYSRPAVASLEGEEMVQGEEEEEVEELEEQEQGNY
jgi:hypothetical protein